LGCGKQVTTIFVGYVRRVQRALLWGWNVLGLERQEDRWWEVVSDRGARMFGECFDAIADTSCEYHVKSREGKQGQ